MSTLGYGDITPKTSSKKKKNIYNLKIKIILYKKRKN